MLAVDRASMRARRHVLTALYYLAAGAFFHSNTSSGDRQSCRQISAPPILCFGASLMIDHRLFFLTTSVPALTKDKVLDQTAGIEVRTELVG